MDTDLTQLLLGKNLASASEHLMFAILPAGIAILATPFYDKTSIIPPESTFLTSILSFVSIVMLFCQFVAAGLRYSAPAASEISSAATVLAVIASLSVTVVMRSRYAFEYRPAMLPLLLIGTTLFHDSAIARQYFLSSSWTLVTAQVALVLSKLGFIFLWVIEYRRHVHPAHALGSKDLSPYWLFVRSFFVSVADQKQTFTAADLSENTGIEDQRILFCRFLRLWDRADKKANLALLRVCVMTLISQCIVFVVAEICFVFFTLSQPFLLQYIVSALERKVFSNAVARNSIVAAVIICLGITTSRAISDTMRSRISASIRSILITAVHNKMLRVRIESLHDCASGEIFSSDIQSIIAYVDRFHDQARGVFSVIIGSALLYHSIGFAFLALSLPIFLMFLLSVHHSKTELAHLQAYQRQSGTRINAIRSVIAQLRNIKIMGLGPVLGQYLERKIDDEIQALKRWRRNHGSLISLSAFRQTVNPAIVLAIGIFWTQTISLASIATIFACLELSLHVSDSLVKAQYFYLRSRLGYPAVHSFQNFLLLPELPLLQDSSTSVSNQPGSLASPKYAIELVDVTVSLNGEPVFEAMNLEIPEGSVSTVIGPVGCGKTTLLRLFLGEVQPSAGTIVCNYTSKALCGQTPWFPCVTVRQMIIGTSGYQLGWYTTILVTFFLDADVVSWPDGDSTSLQFLAPRLTESQKQRLALARAFYAKPSLLVLDDTFSRIERPTASTILERLFGPNGLSYTWNCTSVIVTNTHNHLRFADTILEIKEDGQLWEHHDVRNFFNTTPVAGYFDIETTDSGVSVDPDQLPSFIGGERSSKNDHQSTARSAQSVLGRTWDTLSYLARLRGGRSLLFGLLPCGVSSFIELLPPMILAISHQFIVVDARYFACYCLFSLLNVVSNRLCCEHYHISMCCSILYTLHVTATKTLLNATPLYTSTADSGQLLALFTIDFDVASKALANAVLLAPWFECSILVLTATIVTGARYGVLLVPVVILSRYTVQYISSHLSSQFMSLQTRDEAALKHHLRDVVKGMEHIRAFTQQHQEADKMSNIIHTSQKIFYHTRRISDRSRTCFDVGSSVLTISVVILASLWPQETSGTRVALSLLSISIFTDVLCQSTRILENLQWDLEIVSRIRRFCEDTPKEQVDTLDASPAVQWPSAGELEFVQAAVKADDTMLLSDHSMKATTIAIEAGEKVGLGGYPNHGQSSVILAVLRLVDYTGNIRIDGREVKSVPHDILRSNITTITEDGIAISGSVRINLDPYCITDDRFTDTDLISMLTRVGLWQIVSRRGGLDADISSMHFSRGHLQLLNLARGALHKRRAGTRIVLIDEATSSLDVDTEFQMSDFMDGEFAGATVLIVAQRLQCFETADVVLLMREGRVDSILRQDEDTGEWYEDFDSDDDNDDL